MQLEKRKIQVGQAIEVSSVWAIPENYQAGVGSAVILAHGAGNNMDHAFMSHFHLAFAEAGLLSVKFNFPYMEVGRKAPDRMPLLESTFKAVINAVRTDASLSPKHLFLAGKSMGGRVASHLAAAGEDCRGLILLGYPLHPPKKTDSLRVGHWPGINCPVLFVQGTRDSLCELELLQSHLPAIAGPVALHIVKGGDHSFKVPKTSGKSQEEVWREANQAISSWIADNLG